MRSATLESPVVEEPLLLGWTVPVALPITTATTTKASHPAMALARCSVLQRPIRPAMEFECMAAASRRTRERTMKPPGVFAGGKPHHRPGGRCPGPRSRRRADTLRRRPPVHPGRCDSAPPRPITPKSPMVPHVDVPDAPANGTRSLNGHPPRAGAMDPGVERRDTTPFVERTPVRSPFPPIADYGFLSDCHTGALVAPDGTVEWLCPPRFDAPSVFGAILDRSAGGFRLGPSAMGVPAG